MCVVMLIVLVMPYDELFEILISTSNTSLKAVASEPVLLEFNFKYKEDSGKSLLTNSRLESIISSYQTNIKLTT